jgi:hypothetical protein
MRHLNFRVASALKLHALLAEAKRSGVSIRSRLVSEEDIELTADLIIHDDVRITLPDGEVMTAAPGDVVVVNFAMHIVGGGPMSEMHLARFNRRKGRGRPGR